jgi:hypothetical protein
LFDVGCHVGDCLLGLQCSLTHVIDLLEQPSTLSSVSQIADALNECEDDLDDDIGMLVEEQVTVIDSVRFFLALSNCLMSAVMSVIACSVFNARSRTRTRQYGECAQLLQAVIQLMAHFKSYRSIDQIAMLSRNVIAASD